LNRASLETIATKGGYVNGNNTKEVLAYVKSSLDNIQKTEFESTQIADFQSQFQWFLGFAFVLLFWICFWKRKRIVKKLNLFNEEK
jgi:Ca-activated chloride channel family protein